MITDPTPTSRIPAQVSRALGANATLLASDLRHPNVHLRTESLFVKVFQGHREYFEAEVAAAAARPSALRSPRLATTGELDDGRPWAAYDWVELETPPVGAAMAEATGRQVGLLHAGSRRVPGLRERSPDLVSAVLVLVDRIAVFDEPLADRVRRLLDEVGPAGSLDDPTSSVLLHGDLGWRNALRGPDGDMWLIDFEHARWGHPLLEFAKAWDRELTEPQIRAAFLRGYRDVTDGPVPTDDSMRVVRLWAAAGIFPYAHQHRDVEFADHGRVVLDRLESAPGSR